MQNTAFLLLLGAGAAALYRWRNPGPPSPTLERREGGGRQYLIRRSASFYDVLDAQGRTLVRVQTDTNRALFWAKNDAATQAIVDLGISR